MTVSYSVVNDHFALWSWRPHELPLNALHILSFTAKSIIKLAWTQVSTPSLWSSVGPRWVLFTEFLGLVSQSPAVSRFWKPCLSSQSGQSVSPLWTARLLCPRSSPDKNTRGVATPFSRGSSWPRDQIRVSRISGRFFTFWATREAPDKRKGRQ